MSISLSSHVLDTTLGKPAANMKLALTTTDGQVIQAQTDSDGRCNQWQDFDFQAVLAGSTTHQPF